MNNENDDDSNFLKGNIIGISSIDILEHALNSQKDLPSKQKRSIFKSKESKNPITIIFFILLSCIIIAVGVYLILNSSIEKVKIKLENSQIFHTYKDKRVYEVIELTNGIEFVLISHPKTSINAMGVTIGTQNSNDGGVLGLKNLYIHSIEKNLTTAPSSQFQKELSTYMINTISELRDNSTSFAFEVEKEGFDKALKLFADFMRNVKISNWSNSFSQKEIQREFERDKENLSVIERQIVYAVIFNDTTGYFPQGNKDEFNKHKNINEILKDYASSILYGKNIKIALYSNLRLGQMKGLAVKYFKSFPMEAPSKVNVKTIEEKKLLLGKIITVEFDDSNYQYVSVSYYFDKKEIPNVDLYLKYIKYLFNDKGNKSLYINLFNLGILNSIESAISIYSPSTIEFRISFKTILKDTGDVETEFIMIALLAFIKKIKEAKNHDLLYDEFEKISYYNFKYEPNPSEVADYTKHMSQSLFNVSNLNLSLFTYGSYYMPPYNATSISSILDKFTYNNSVILIGTNDINNIGKVTKQLAKGGFTSQDYNTETYYKTKYKYDDINEEKIKEMESDQSFDKLIEIRGYNEYITNITKIITPYSEYNSSGGLGPSLIFNENHLKLYHRVDLEFEMPRVSIYINIMTIYTKTMNTTDEYINLFQYNLLKYSILNNLNNAIEAGNSIQISNTAK